VLTILIAAFLIGHAQGIGLLIPYIASCIPAWLYWSFMVPKWRTWALNNGANEDELEKWGRLTLLTFKKGSLLSMTEFKDKNNTPNNMDNKKIIKTSIGFVIGMLAFWGIKQIFFAPSFDKEMMKAASEINKSCPIMVDNVTRLDNSVAMPNNTFQYNYTLIGLVKDSLNIDDIKGRVEPILINNTKTNPDLKIFRDYKTTMSYFYKDRKGQFLFKIDVTPDKYKE